MNADALCTTRHISRDQVYRKFNRDTAKISVVEEMGAMTIPQFLLGWPRFRPVIAVRVDLQLQPTVLSKYDKDHRQNYLNSFGPYGDISALERIYRYGWPVFVYDEQLRIARGGFDLTREVFFAGC